MSWIQIFLVFLVFAKNHKRSKLLSLHKSHKTASFDLDDYAAGHSNHKKDSEDSVEDFDSGANIDYDDDDIDSSSQKALSSHKDDDELDSDVSDSISTENVLDDDSQVSESGVAKKGKKKENQFYGYSGESDDFDDDVVEYKAGEFDSDPIEFEVGSDEYQTIESDSNESELADPLLTDELDLPIQDFDFMEDAFHEDAVGFDESYDDDDDDDDDEDDEVALASDSVESSMDLLKSLASMPTSTISSDSLDSSIESADPVTHDVSLDSSTESADPVITHIHTHTDPVVTHVHTHTVIEAPKIVKHTIHHHIIIPTEEPKHEWGYEHNGCDWDIGMCHHSQNPQGRQSPVDLPDLSMAKAHSNPIELDYCQTTYAHLGVKHGSMKWKPQNEKNILKHKGSDYQLIGWHMHAPSEHTVGGVHADFEVHMVHKRIGPNDKSPVPGFGHQMGDIIVIGVLGYTSSFPGSVNKNHIFNHLSGKNGGVSLKFDASDLLPTKKVLKYFEYKGSLTTPPCSETVDWHIMATPINIDGSSFDISCMRNFGPRGNFRYTQALNGRVIKGCGDQNCHALLMDKNGKCGSKSSTYWAPKATLPPPPPPKPTTTTQKPDEIINEPDQVKHIVHVIKEPRPVRKVIHVIKKKVVHHIVHVKREPTVEHHTLEIEKAPKEINHIVHEKSPPPVVHLKPEKMNDETHHVIHIDNALETHHVTVKKSPAPPSASAPSAADSTVHEVHITPLDSANSVQTHTVQINPIDSPPADLPPANAVHEVHVFPHSEQQTAASLKKEKKVSSLGKKSKHTKN